MNTEKENLKRLFKEQFTNDFSFDIEIKTCLKSYKKLLKKITTLLGNEIELYLTEITKTTLDYFENKFSKIKTRAKFNLLLNSLFTICKYHNIKDNVSLAIVIAMTILFYTENNDISINEIDKNYSYFNKENGPFISPEHWTIKQCQKFNIDYFLCKFNDISNNLENLSVTIAQDNSFNISVLEKNNNIFMHLLLEDNT